MYRTGTHGRSIHLRPHRGHAGRAHSEKAPNRRRTSTPRGRAVRRVATGLHLRVDVQGRAAMLQAPAVVGRTHRPCRLVELDKVDG